MSPASRPILSVVVVIVSDTVRRGDATLLAGCLERLRAQQDAPPMEVIVPHLADVEGLADVRRRFPDVRFIEVPEVTARIGDREHHDRLRARGLAAATGDIVGLLEDHAAPHPRWCASVVAAHRQPAAAIGGAIENGIDRALNWAVYYCDFGRYQNPPAGETPFASDANVTYKRDALERVRPHWEHSFREIVVNGALSALGERVVLDPRVIAYQRREGLTLGTAVRERFSWGRSYAATRRLTIGAGARFAYAALSPALPIVLLLRMTRTASERGSLATFLKASPLVALLVATWSVGECVGYLGGVSDVTAASASGPQAASPAASQGT